MVKKDSISSDIEIIKEFEELKIKQKLLIDALKKKIVSNENKLFLDINSKLDFLIKIFKESTESVNDEEEIPIEVKIENVVSKSLRELNKSISDLSSKFEDLSEKVGNLISQTKNGVGFNSSNNLSLDNDSSSNLSLSNSNNLVHNESNNKSISNSNELPLLDIKSEVSKLDNDSKKKKKGGVFKWL